MCTLSEVFERIAKNQIQHFISRYNLLNPHQFSFRSGHSATSPLLKVHDDIHYVIDKKGVALLILVDFQKLLIELCMPNHQKKLSYHFCFARSAVSLINSCLNGCNQIVDANVELSNQINMISSVPQGSVLGSLSFSLFINDLPNVLKHCKINIFTDDV